MAMYFRIRLVVEASANADYSEPYVRKSYTQLESSGDEDNPISYFRYSSHDMDGSGEFQDALATAARFSAFGYDGDSDGTAVQNNDGWFGVLTNESFMTHGQPTSSFTYSPLDVGGSARRKEIFVGS